MNYDEKDDEECLVSLSNIIVDLLNDKRISKDIRCEYASKFQNVFPAIALLSMDYAKKQYGVKRLNKSN
ncbi:hypothetical protein [Clostridium beijerinckii]|uniref:hypothetical protein n=1 Tax=Clostridium beijerinckii TaxID=1520 RepID=UPI00098CEDFC|nr:hypothetical protein [Clostridium beijerinckii]MBA8935564.1 hypothetical protein [Clostridium beijerinckii]NRU39959.1 hypothetical protein [Clostridium beijerinckii]NSA96762.1 hypothetical protein [Clostridium beijerinckii]OOM61306.1 hypothetical protein CLOBI_26670 [Clostridium beijerinckii]OOM71806.1 hypothetical protein CLBEIC_12200 [Clostridium beijerinckii]